MTALAARGKVAVSVIVNCLNGETYLREALDSVYAQIYPDWEIVFWDNASTDGSGKIARGFDERLRYFRNESTVPLYAARRQAMEACRGALVGFLDTDDVWLPGKLAEQVPLFDDPQVGLVHSNALVMDESGRKKRRHRRRRPSGQVFGRLLGDYHLCLPTVLISREVCGRHGLAFDPELHFSGDAGLFMQVARVSKVRYLDEITAIYREHPGSGTLTAIERLPLELERILAVLAKGQPGFYEDFGREVVRFRLRGQLSVLSTYLRRGRPDTTRAMARGYVSLLAPFLALLGTSFLPYEWVARARRRVAKP